MKQLIVLVAMIGLGIFIAGLITSDKEGTVKSSMTSIWKSEITRQNTYP